MSSVREYAALALGLIGDAIAAPALERVTDDEDPGVRAQAQRSLRLIGA